MKSAFLSYSRKDKSTATKLYADLESRGLSIWIDLQDIQVGTLWSEEIEKAISESGFFLLLLSPDSVTSEYVQKEYTFAILKEKRLIPIMIAPCSIPNAISHIQYVDLRNYQNGLRRVLSVFPPDAFNKETSIQATLANLRSPDLDTRIESLILVGTGRLQEALETTISALEDPNLDVRRWAAWALGELRSIEALSGLVAALNDRSYDVRSNAGWALVHLGQQAVPHIANVLKESANAEARDMAYQVLLRIGGSEAEHAIKQYGAHYK